MKTKIINLVEKNTAYPDRFIFQIPTPNEKSIDASVEYTDLSYLLNNKGVFYEGKLTTSNHVYFHWLSFDVSTINVDLYTDERIEQFAAIFDKRLPQGVMTKEEATLLFERIDSKVGLSIGVKADDLANKKTILISDASNYPWNFGFFVIKDGRLLETGDKQLKGKHWILVYNNNNSFEQRLIDLDNPSFSANISDIKFGLYLNPVVIDGKPLTSLFQQIPGITHTLLYSFRGGTSHIFTEEKISSDELDTKKHQYLQQQIEQSESKATKEMKNLLQGNNVKRGIMGHTVFGLTATNKLIIFKIFNRAAKDNGLFLEQIGTAMKKISLHFGENIVFAGVGANGGDVRTFLGSLKQYKNIPENNPNIFLQEKIEPDKNGNPPRLEKPIYIHITEK